MNIESFNRPSLRPQGSKWGPLGGFAVTGGVLFLPSLSCFPVIFVVEDDGEEEVGTEEEEEEEACVGCGTCDVVCGCKIG